jgi:phage antirepressor YoqD-like protein
MPSKAALVSLEWCQVLIHFRTFRKMFRIDPAITTRIYDFLTTNEMLFRDEPKVSRPKMTKEDGDLSKVESQALAASETPAST